MESCKRRIICYGGIGIYVYRERIGERHRHVKCDLPAALVEMLQVPEESIPFFGVRNRILTKNFGHSSTKSLFTPLHVSLQNIDVRQHDR